MNIKHTRLIGLCLLLPVHQTRNGRPVRHSMPWHRSIGLAHHGSARPRLLLVPEQREFIASNTLAHPATWLVPGSTECGFGCGVGRFRRVQCAEGNASLTLFNVGFFSVRNGRHS